jgi:hypothetical protein
MGDDEYAEYHPELAGYEPGSGTSLRHPAFVRIMRITIIVAVAALIVPGAAYTIGLQNETAQAACGIVVRDADARATGSTARFELTGAAGPGWYCYLRSFDGSELLLRPLGLIPGLQHREVGV